jgi:hypothetical protein
MSFLIEWRCQSRQAHPVGAHRIASFAGRQRPAAPLFPVRKEKALTVVSALLRD